MADKAAEPRAVRRSAARRARPRPAPGRTTGPGFARTSSDGAGLPPAVQNQGNQAVGAFLRREAGRAEPLPPSLRSGMESYFGTDLSGVRLHLSGDAARSANAQRARAYTVDQDIVFGAGEYRPHDAAGRRLIAHEVTHTVQQARGGPHPGGSERTERAAAEHAGRSASGERRVTPVVGSAVGVAREEAGSAPAEKTDTKDSLGLAGDIVVDAITRKLVGQGPHQAMLRATLIGFFAELVRQVDDPKVRDRLGANFVELTTSKSLDEMQTAFSAGSAAGLVSPVTDFFGLLVLGEHLRHFAESLAIGLLKNETGLIEEAKSLAKDFGDLLGSMADTLAGMFKEHPEGLVGIYQHLEQEGVRRAGEQGRLAARKIIGSLTSKEEAKPVETLGQIVGTHTESEKMGAASAVSGKLSRVQEAIFHTRPARIGYGVGEALGAVVGNLLVMAFTEGVGSAITEIAGKLGRAAPMLARAAEFLAEVGKAISAVENAIGTLIEALLKKVKILGKIFQPFLDLMLRLQTFLQKLTGVAHRLETAVAKEAVTAVREVTPAAPSAGVHAAESGAPKPTGKGNVVDIREAAAKRAAKDAAAKKPAAGKGAAAEPARQAEHEAAAESGVFPAARQSEHAAQGEGVVEFKRTGTTDQPVAVSPGAPARGPRASSPGPTAPKRRVVPGVKPRPAPAAPAPKARGGAGPKPGGTQRPRKAAAPTAPKGPAAPRLCRVDELGTPGVTPMQRGRYHVPGAPGEFDHRLIQMARETRAGSAGVSLQDFSRTNIATARISHGPGGPVEYLASPNIPGSSLGLERGFDSEQLLIQRAVDLRKAGMKVTLDQLYTERIPCPACTRLLAQYFPEAKVFYTVGTTGRLRMYGDLSRGRALMRAYGMLGDQ
ncbi:DUF4157 domain-containing protein [Streptomyces luteogriseus]|uniref:eCIS core domain-containing protein n=1 Tax=Streptomyces luteogriseus TaxID=68233 RepID=UPI00381E32DC